MNLSETRAAAADAIRGRFPEQDAEGRHIVRVVEVDAITERDVPRLADGIFSATDATVPDTRGPAAIAVMAAGRQSSQAVDLAAYTVVRTRLAIELADAGRGRGLATLDLVEVALSELPGHGLPRLLVESAAVRLDRTQTEADETIHVYVTRCTWPPAFPDPPLAAERGGSMDAIRDHVAAAITGGLPAATEDQAGRTEAHCRVAQITGLVPRARVALDTQRETRGGEFDLAVIANQNFSDDQGRRWTMRVAEQEIVATVTVWHRNEDLADEAISRIMGELDGSRVAWPGSFDANNVAADGTVTVTRENGGQYRQDVELLNRTPAEWDAVQGLHMAMCQCTVQSVTQLAPADQSTGAVTLRHTAEWC